MCTPRLTTRRPATPRSRVGSAWDEHPGGTSVGNWFPDQLGDVDYEIGSPLRRITRCTHFADTGAQANEPRAEALASGAELRRQA
jgi:hypothetical protein